MIKRSMVAVVVICCACLVSGVAAASSDTTRMQDQRVAIQVCYKIPLPGEVSESYLTVDVAKEKIVSREKIQLSPDQTSGCESDSSDGKDVRAHRTIVKRLSQRGESAGLDPKLMKIIKSIENDSSEGYLDASPDSRFAILYDDYRDYFLVDVRMLSAYRISINQTFRRLSFAWSPDSRFLAYSDPDSNELQLFNLNTWEQTKTFSRVGLRILAIEWSQDMQKLALAGLKNRRLNIFPFGFLAALAGHPEFKNDLVLNVITLDKGARFSIALERGISEWSGGVYPYLKWSPNNP